MIETEKDNPYEATYRKDYESDFDLHKNYIQSFDAYEAMLLGYVWDSVSNSVNGSKMTDSYATTLAKERADRVMAKLPEGNTEPAGKADQGKAAFMDILRQKWIYPNANAQRPFQEKLNLWQLYSSVYGYMPMFYDWNANQTTGYVGPDCWLWNPRNLVPQQGRVSIEDMDYVTALTWVSRKWLQGKLDRLDEKDSDGWDAAALKALIDRASDKSTPDTYTDTVTERYRMPGGSKKGICLATRYESGPDGEWCVFAPEHGFMEVRRIANPHKNGRIPFVIKYSQPLFDSFYGLGDFQRAKSLQFGRDGLRNFYFKGVKMNLIPPIVANANGVIKHTLDYREGAVMLETLPQSIRRLETSTAGLATYQAAMSDLTGSLLSQFGTQNASLPGAEALNPSQGKTPAAINMYSDKEATRDGSERRHMETAIEQLTDGFFSLVVNIGTESIPVALFSADIEEIVKSGLADVKDLFKKFKSNATETGGELTINPAKLKGVEYRFSINPNSTAQENKQALAANFEALMTDIAKFQNIFKDDARVEVNWPAIMRAREEMSGIKGAGEFITVNPEAPSPQQQQQQMEQMKLSQTQVQAPGNGQVHESADLVKLYLGTPDLSLQAQIIKALGFEPGPPPPAEPVTTSTGHSFSDPSIAAAADAIANHGADVQPPPPVEPAQPTPPTVSGSGHSFADPHLADVANAVSKL